MTAPAKARRPIASVIARGMRLAVAASTLAVIATVALAQPNWDPTVSTGPAPPPAVVAVPKPKTVPPPAPAPLAAPTVEVVPPAAQPDPKIAMVKAAPAPRAKLETGTIAGDYCANIASPAADARFAWQKKTLADLEQELAKRIAVLEEKTAEYQKWLARRDDFSKKANETVLRIYARMRPDAAAVQLAALDEETAASVLTKLEPRMASQILNEMEPAHAVRLTATISGAGRVPPPAPPKTTAEAKAK